jgi:DNA-directed RNA polymerase subunit RPC12/RpoP
MIHGSHQMQIFYTCFDCGHKCHESQLVMDMNNFLRQACPKCRSDDLDESVEDVQWPQPVAAVPVSTAGLEEQARVMLKRIAEEAT